MGSNPLSTLTIAIFTFTYLLKLILKIAFSISFSAKNTLNKLKNFQIITQIMNSEERAGMNEEMERAQELSQMAETLIRMTEDATRDARETEKALKTLKRTRPGLIPPEEEELKPHEKDLIFARKEATDNLPKALSDPQHTHGLELEQEVLASARKIHRFLTDAIDHGGPKVSIQPVVEQAKDICDFLGKSVHSTPASTGANNSGEEEQMDESPVEGEEVLQEIGNTDEQQ